MLYCYTYTYWPWNQGCFVESLHHFRMQLKSLKCVSIILNGKKWPFGDLKAVRARIKFKANILNSLKYCMLSVIFLVFLNISDQSFYFSMCYAFNLLLLWLRNSNLKSTKHTVAYTFPSRSERDEKQTHNPFRILYSMCYCMGPFRTVYVYAHRRV